MSDYENSQRRPLPGGELLTDMGLVMAGICKASLHVRLELAAKGRRRAAPAVWARLRSPAAGPEGGQISHCQRVLFRRQFVTY